MVEGERERGRERGREGERARDRAGACVREERGREVGERERGRVADRRVVNGEYMGQRDVRSGPSSMSVPHAPMKREITAVLARINDKLTLQPSALHLLHTLAEAHLIAKFEQARTLCLCKRKSTLDQDDMRAAAKIANHSNESALFEKLRTDNQ